MQVEIFIPCTIDQFYPETGLNMVKILEKLGCEVHYTDAQSCCALSAYQAGYRAEAQAVAEKFLQDFAQSDHYIVSPSAACVGMIRYDYTRLLGEAWQEPCYQLQKRTFEFTEFLTDILGIEKLEGARLEGLATYHDACGAYWTCGIQASPRLLLSHVEGLQLVEMKGAETCCGYGAGLSTAFPSISVALAERKIDQATITQADFIISSEATCLMQLQGYIEKNRKQIQAKHIIDVLASGW